MSLDIAIASNPQAPVIVAPDMTFNQQVLEHGSLQLQQMYPNNQNGLFPLNSTLTKVTFPLPSNNQNFYRSELQYNRNLGAVTVPANKYIWTHDDVATDIYSIEVVAANGQQLVYITDFQNYFKTVGKRELSITDYETLDDTAFLTQSNAPRNVVPALRAGTAAASNPSNKNFTEPAYMSVSAIGQAKNKFVRFPLRFVFNTILALDKTIYWGQQLYLNIQFGTINKVAFQSDSNANPSAGTPAPYTGVASISDLVLQLAVETDPIAKARQVAATASGLTMFMPYVTAWRNSGSGATQNIIVQINPGDGMTVQKIYHTVFAADELYDKAYDCSNLPLDALDPGNGNVLAPKVKWYSTILKGSRIQNLELCTDNSGGINSFGDYLVNKNQFKGSILANRNIYQYNWSHCDDWTDLPCEYKYDNRNDIISGMKVEQAQVAWTFNGRSMTNTNCTHYSYVVLTKRLQIRGSEVIIG